ncbi:MAG TPA: chromate efflux transporter [Opitutaceae bacterium]|jgi:chromate transporter|nr:chromate efflux transporter [Opitutaceae bacterium]
MFKNAPPTFREALRFWLKLGFISFGGPAGQIAIMQTELVDRKKWIDQEHFLHALNYCMLLPGPEAQQLAIYCGWLLHRARGGLAAGVLFVLPSAVILWVLSYIYVSYGALPWIAAIFYGLKPAVIAIVAAAMLRIGKKSLKTPMHWALSAVAFGMIFFLHAPFPAIVLGAGVLGFFGGSLFGWSKPALARNEASAFAKATADETEDKPRGAAWLYSLRIVVVGGALWFAPVVAVGLWQGWDSALAREGFFFSKAAMVTIGGAYAVLPYVAQQAVVKFSWLGAPQMLDGLGLAETTPGPLIMVLQFVGFLGGWNHPGALPPLIAATLGAALTTWVTFVPCFIWIFLGAPHIERMRGHPRLNTALTAVTAAVVGVILNLAVWFAGHVIFPKHAPVDWFALGVALVAFLAMQRFKVGIIPVVFAGGALGLLWQLLLVNH